jgi:hypothetical protein
MTCSFCCRAVKRVSCPQRPCYRAAERALNAVFTRHSSSEQESGEHAATRHATGQHSPEQGVTRIVMCVMFKASGGLACQTLGFLAVPLKGNEKSSHR